MDLKNISYEVIYKNIKNPKIQFKAKNLILHLPYGYENELRLLEKYEKWISKKYLFIEECLELSSRIKLNDLSFTELTNTALCLIYKHDTAHKIKSLSLRYFKNKWASINSKNQITLNKRMTFLPEHLIEYIIFHEITHTVEKRHGSRFRELIKNKYSDYKKYEKELFAYWLLITEIKEL